MEGFWVFFFPKASISPTESSRHRELGGVGCSFGSSSGHTAQGDSLSPGPLAAVRHRSPVGIRPVHLWGLSGPSGLAQSLCVSNQLLMMPGVLDSGLSQQSLTPLV